MQHVRITVFVSGVAAVVMQTILIREGLVLFGGYELVSGILLCFWLLWGGLGSFLGTRLRGSLGILGQRYAVLLLLLCVCSALSLMGMRYALRIFALPFGEVMSIENILLISCIVLAPVCLLFGALFPVAAHILTPEGVYLLEGIGAFLGGIIITFILLPLVSPFGILLLTIIIISMCVFVMVGKRKLIFVPIVLLSVFFKIGDIETFFRQSQMPGQRLIDVRESRYSLISVTRSASQINFYTNGIYDFSYPDDYSTEEAVHYPLLLHQEPRSVLLIGGGVANCVAQILKHPSVREVTCVELDPMIIAMGREHVDERFGNDSRLKIVLGDARLFVKRTKNVFDCVIINVPDPVNAQINRLYTVEFFSELSRVIHQDGVVSIRLTAPPDIISPLFGQLLNTVNMSLAASFPHTLALPAAKTTFIGSKFPIDRNHIVDILKQRSAERDLNLKYVNEYYFDYNLQNRKISYLNDRLQQSGGHLNTDVHPVCYYYSTMLWGGVISGMLRSLFLWLFSINPLFFLVPLLLVFPFYGKRSLVYVSVYAVGATEISAEVILIVLFQTLYGYLYGWIGVIIAFYMLGLTAGTWFYVGSFFIRHARIRTLSSVQFTMSGFLLLIVLITALRPPGIYLFIPILVFFGGFLGGVHFPMSIGIMKRRSAGVIYGLDLIGSGVGALLTAVILIPVIGIIYTLLVFVVLNLLVGIGLRTV